MKKDWQLSQMSLEQAQSLSPAEKKRWLALRKDMDKFVFLSLEYKSSDVLLTTNNN